MSLAVVPETDKFGTTHFNLTGKEQAEHVLTAVKNACVQLAAGTIKAISVNITRADDGKVPTREQLASILPPEYPIDMIRDEQKGLLRFVYDPAGKIPRGGNCDLGATALVIDPDASKVLVTIMKSNGRLRYPGGRADGNETPFQTAAREAEEEAGVKLDPAQGELISIQRFPKNQFVQGVNILVRWSIPGASESMKPQPDGVETSAATWMDIEEARDQILPRLTDEILIGQGWSPIQEKSWYQNIGAPAPPKMDTGKGGAAATAQ